MRDEPPDDNGGFRKVFSKLLETNQATAARAMEPALPWQRVIVYTCFGIIALCAFLIMTPPYETLKQLILGGIALPSLLVIALIVLATQGKAPPEPESNYHGTIEPGTPRSESHKERHLDAQPVGDQPEARDPRDEMRRQIGADIDAAFERIDIKLDNGQFSLFMEAKNGDPEHGYTNYPGLTEDSVSQRLSATQDKINEVILAERNRHREFKQAITAEEIESIEERLKRIIVVQTTGLFSGVFLVYKPVTEAEWNDEQERIQQHRNRLRKDIVSSIAELKGEFNVGG